MPYVNSRLCALVAMGLSLLAVPGLRAQNAAPIRGDVDGDGRVTRADADAVRAYLVRGTLPGGRAIMPAGDANGDGRVTAADAALISRFAAGVDVSRFPVGRPVEGPSGPGNGGERIYTLLECTVDVDSATTSCQPASQSVTDAHLSITLSSPHVTLTGSGGVSHRVQPANEDTTTTNVTLTNNIGQPLGTTNGTDPHADGTRLVFTFGPNVTAVKSGTIAGSTVRVDNSDGTTSIPNVAGTQTYTNRHYYQYNGVIAPNTAHPTPKPIRFVYSSNVKTYGFSVLVSAPVQFEHGWITVSPAATQIIAVDSSVTLSGVVRNQYGAIQADGINWSSSSNAVATVDGTGKVTGVTEGTVTITAESNANSNRKGTRTVIVDRFPTVVSTNPADEATGVLPGSNIEITFSEAVDVTTSSFDLECPSGSDLTYTITGSGTNVITLNPDSDLPAAATCVVTVNGNQVSDSDTNDGPNFMPGNYSFNFDVNIQAVADAFGTTTTGNVRINSASTSPVFSVTANDVKTASTTISFAGWEGTAGKTKNGGDVVMTTSGADMGKFTYNPPAGFEGTDSLEYTITAGAGSATAKVALPVSGMIWFINNAASSCTARASGCGRLTSPYSSLAAFQAENNGTGDNPGPGDNVFLYESAAAYTGPVTLLGTQKLIGQDAGAELSAITGISPATGSDALPAMNTGGNAVTINGASGGVVLGADNLLRGFAISTTGGTALSGTNFGTPTIAEVTLAASAGPALSLDNGTVNSTFATASSTNSTGRGISLTNVNGSLVFSAGSISGATAAALLVSGGDVDVTWPGNITQANNAPLLDVQGSHTGTLLFQTGTLSASNGTGLQFNAAQGTYTFNGTTTLNGGDAGVDITNGSGGTFSFGTSTQITNPSGTAFNVYGSAPTVTYSGNITRDGTSTGRLVEIGEQSGGTVTFSTGTLSATSTSNLSTGIALSNADGTVNFNGTTTLNGGDAGVDILSGSGGTFTFGANTAITNPSGTAFNVNASTPSVTYSGNITKNGTSAGLLVDVTNQTGGGSLAANGTITFQTGTLSGTSSASTGIQLNNADGTVNFNGTTTLSGGDNGVDVIGGSTGSISFPAGAGITNSSGPALFVDASAPSSLTFAGPISTNASRPVHIEDLTGGTITISGAVTGTGQGILVQNNTSGSPTITFAGTRNLNTAANAAVTLDNNDAATINMGTAAMTLQTTTGAGFRAVNGGTVNVTGNNNTVSSTGGTAVAIQNTTIGGSNVNFRSITSTGSASAIRLDNTGNTGGLKVTGDGFTANSGGILTMNGTSADSAAVTFNNTANLSLEFMRISITTGNGASGITGNNIQGTNLVRNTVIDYNGTAPAAVPPYAAVGARFVQNSTNATVSLDGVTLRGKRDGGTAGSLSAQGNSVVTFNVIDSNTGDAFPSLMTDLFGSGWVIAAGDNAGSTAVVNLTVRDSRFENAAANGTNNLEVGAQQNATLNYKIKNNQFSNVAKASAISGIITAGTFHSGRFGSNTAMDSIVGNTITNSGTSSAATDLGYIGIRIALDNNVAGIQHRVVIANNTITDLWRQGILLSSRGSNNGFNVRVENNTVGTAALPVGQSNRRGIEVELQASASMNIEVLNNNVTGAGTVDAAAALGLRTGIEVGTATMNATVVGNTLRSTSAGTSARFRAETAGTGTGVMCLDLRNNNLEDNSKTYGLLHSAGTFRVEGAGAGAVTNASIQAANTTGTGNVSGTVLYNNNTNCTQPAGL